ncbi:MAG: acetoacetate--CoA ligase [Thermodesulfobacteriota bacterium]
MKPLWVPSEERRRNANITRFIDTINGKFSLDISDYHGLWRWSIENREDFWASVWDFGNIIASQPYSKVLEDSPTMIGAKWFEGARLNFAENLLRFRDDRTALVFKGEGQVPVRMTYAQLYDEVSQVANALRDAGVVTGDRVAGYVPNMIQSVVAMLAATSIGAIWSSCSPDFGIKGVLDRFGQIEPKILFTANGYRYNGKAHDSLERIAGIIRELPSINQIVVIPYTEERADLKGLPKAIHYQDFISKAPAGEIRFEQLPFNHPVYIMYSSGTTGLPKCMVHGAGGTLIQHLKELVLHCDLKREDNIYYFTTCGWMMWNWLVSSLAVGATILLYDGSPFYPEAGAMFQFAEDEKMTIFGTSARYIAAVEKEGLRPKEQFDLSSLKTMCSTGSPLSEESFRFVYREIKEDIDLASISGGTDIISCFALGCPILPVYEGELQCRGLGMAVESFGPDGKPVRGEQGELVCVKTFPSQPIYFWNDPDNSKYKAAYFSVFENVWHHGDYIEITEHEGVKIFGRSDATLNPSGVRIGTAEIYRVVEAMDEISDSIVVGQDWEGDVRVILFVKLAAGAELSDDLVKKIKRNIRENTTPRHVPAKILPIADIPVTLNGKKVELAVRNVIEGRPVTNKDALANPEALDLYANLPELQS